MARRHEVAAVAAFISITTTLATAPALAQERERAATVILECSYQSVDGFRTKVEGAETAGPVPARLSAALASEITCAQAATLLASAGFALVHASTSHPSAASDVDGRDFLIWQRQYGGT